jgi:hypothetical protein
MDPLENPLEIAKATTEAALSRSDHIVYEFNAEGLMEVFESSGRQSAGILSRDALILSSANTSCS